MQADQGSTAVEDILSFEATFAAEADITVSQFHVVDIPISDQIAWKWEHGNPLLPPDQIELLPTQMLKLHKWYMEFTKTSRVVLPMKVTKEHFIKTRCKFILKKSFNYTSLTPSIWVSSVFIVCKWFNSFISKIKSLPQLGQYCMYFVFEWIRQELSERNSQTWIEVHEQFYFSLSSIALSVIHNFCYDDWYLYWSPSFIVW